MCVLTEPTRTGGRRAREEEVVRLTHESCQADAPRLHAILWGANIPSVLTHASASHPPGLPGLDPPLGIVPAG